MALAFSQLPVGVTPKTAPAGSTLVIRDSLPDDLPGIALLQADVDPELRLAAPQYAALWRWLCERNPTGPAKVLVGVEDNGRIVSHETLVRFPLVLDGRERIAGLTCLLVVAQSHRHGLLFTITEKRLLREYQRSGIDIALAVVRDHMVELHLALGFRVVGRLPVFARPYRLGKLARRHLGQRWASRLASPFLRVAEWPLRARFRSRVRGVDIVRVDKFDETLAGDLDAVCDQLGNHTRRTASLLDWRFRQSPNRNYLVLAARDASAWRGYVALRRIPLHEFDALAVVDLVFPPGRPEVGKALLMAVHRTAVEMDVDMAAGIFNPHSPLMPLLRRTGFLKSPEAFTTMVHQPKGSGPALDAQFAHNWHQTWFEHDYV